MEKALEGARRRDEGEGGGRCEEHLEGRGESKGLAVTSRIQH